MSEAKKPHIRLIHSTSPELTHSELSSDHFQKRFFDAQFQIRQFEIQLEQLIHHELKKDQPNLTVLQDLQLRMEALANRQRSWLNDLTETIRIYRTRRNAYDKMKKK